MFWMKSKLVMVKKQLSATEISISVLALAPSILWMIRFLCFFVRKGSQQLTSSWKGLDRCEGSGVAFSSKWKEKVWTYFWRKKISSCKVKRERWYKGAPKVCIFILNHVAFCSSKVICCDLPEILWQLGSTALTSIRSCISKKTDPGVGRFVAYLIFVIFFYTGKILDNKIYTEKRQFFALNL